MYGVPMPTAVDVASSPENILSQETRTPEKRYRLTTPPRKLVPSTDQGGGSSTQQAPPTATQVLSKDPENTSSMEKASAIDNGYVDFIRNADMELVRT